MTQSPSPPRAAAEPAVRPNRPERRFNGLMPAFLIGLPLATAVLVAIQSTPLHEMRLASYVSHPVEYVEVVMFCCALGALLSKLGRQGTERLAGRAEVLPSWDGQPVPVGEATRLLAGLERLSRRVQSTALVRRVAAVLDFLCRRRTTAELDDHLRALADADLATLEGSYGLVRFITWAIPILGFLGTVLGITEAIAGVNPDVLEHNLNAVTDGLATAFNCTALALALTMITMFLTFVVERLEQGVLENVERFVDRQLAHRFERTGSEGGQFLEVVRHNTQVLLQATEQLVRQQTELWARALEEMDYRRTEEEKRHQERFAGCLEIALQRTLQSHAEQLKAFQKQAVEGSTQLLEQLAATATTVRETGREQQAALLAVAEGIAGQAKMLGQLQAGEKHLLRLEEALNQNLTALAGAQTFEQALHSLTAAVHLLSARVPGDTRNLRLAPRPSPGTAA
jgi:hypothetical protein